MIIKDYYGNPKMMTTLQQAIDHGFLLLRNNETLKIRYWRYCLENNLPFVCVRFKTSFCVVTVDLEGVYKAFQKGFSKRTAQKVEEIFADYNERKYRENWATAMLRGTYAYASRIPIPKALEVAQLLVEALKQEDAFI